MWKYSQRAKRCEVNEGYQINISNRLAALENLSDNVDIKKGWEIITDKTKTSAKENLGYYQLQQNK